MGSPWWTPACCLETLPSPQVAGGSQWAPILWPWPPPHIDHSLDGVGVGDLSSHSGCACCQLQDARPAHGPNTCRLMEAPFSFQAADEQRAAIKEAVAALAKNPNRFQVGRA